MAPAKLKKEPDLTPPPRKGFGFFMDDSDTSAYKPNSSAKKAAASLIPEANWRECEHEERFKRVRIKELAVRNAHFSLRKMLTTLGLQLSANPSCQLRIDKINEILGRKREFKVLVGFLGATGAGKTTLLNAMIGFSDLLPSSSWRASTAVSVEVSYNKSSRRESLFRAEIVYITPEEWSRELQSLFEDMQAVASATEGDNEEGDSERKDRINQSFDKVKYVYPHIRSLAKLGTVSVDELLDHPDVRDVLGSTKAIEKPKKNQLSAAIKQYIDSGDHNDKISAHWPLVKHVKVFVKSGLLEPGIILVDLPGNLDSSAARSAIAEKYYKDLSISCIVADMTRGISEKNAQELLEKFTKRTLQLDGLYNADSLCFVLSKTDQPFDIAQYTTKQYPDLGEQLAADSRKQWGLTRDIAELQRKRNALDKSHKANKKSARELFKEIKEASSRLNAFSCNSSPLLQARKRGADDTDSASNAAPATQEQIQWRNKLAQLENQLSDLRFMIQKEANSLLSYGRRIESLQRAAFFTRSRLIVKCIQHRNELSIAAVRSDYESTLREMGRQLTKPLQVFPVSANVHLKYQNVNNGNKQYLGFPNREDTRIPALRDWLMSTTLDDRDRYAQAFLDDVDAFLDSIYPWISDKYGDTKIPAELREHLEPQLENMLIELQGSLRSLSLSTTNSLKQLVKTNIYSKVSKAQNSAGAKAKRTAEKWALGTHWSTHRVVNRQRGVWKDSRGKDHKWNEELVYDFTSHLVKPWDLTFFRQFPQEMTSYIDRAKALIIDFATASTNKDLCPDVPDGLDVLKDHITRTFNLLRHQTDTAFEGVKKIVKKSHKQAVPAVREFLEPMYEHCASESGRGHYARNKKFIEEFMTDDGIAIHQAGTNAIKAELDQLLDKIPVILAVGSNLVIQQIRDEIKLFFEQHSSDGSRKSTRKVVSVTKVRLQEALLADINVLAKNWISQLPAEEVPEDDEMENEIALNDDLFIDLDKSEDDDYEYNSDGEAY